MDDIDWARADRAETWRDGITAAAMAAYERRHPIHDGMREREREIWDRLTDEDRIMVQSDRAFYGTDEGEIGEKPLSLFDIIAIRQTD